MKIKDIVDILQEHYDDGDEVINLWLDKMDNLCVIPAPSTVQTYLGKFIPKKKGGG